MRDRPDGRSRSNSISIRRVFERGADALLGPVAWIAQRDPASDPRRHRRGRTSRGLSRRRRSYSCGVASGSSWCIRADVRHAVSLVVTRESSCKHTTFAGGRAGPDRSRQSLRFCPAHHRLFHHVGRRLELDERGRWIFIRPDGKIVRDGPPPLDYDVKKWLWDDILVAEPAPTHGPAPPLVAS